MMTIGPRTIVHICGDSTSFSSIAVVGLMANKATMFQVGIKKTLQRWPEDNMQFARSIQLVGARGWFCATWVARHGTNIAFLATVSDVLECTAEISKIDGRLGNITYYQITQTHNIDALTVASISEMLSDTDAVEAYLVRFRDGTSVAFPLMDGLLLEGQKTRHVIELYQR